MFPAAWNVGMCALFQFPDIADISGFMYGI